MIVRPDPPGTAFEEGIAHRLGLGFRNEYGQLAQAIGARVQNGKGFQTQPPRDLAVHTVDHIVQVGVDGVNGNVLPEGQFNGAFNGVRAGKPFQPFEDDRMMADDEVAAFAFGLHHNRFVAVYAHQRCPGFALQVTYLEPTIVIVLLKGRWCPAFENVDDGGDGRIAHDAPAGPIYRPLFCFRHALHR